MCGRYASTRSAADLSALFEALDQSGDGGAAVAARYNLAPTDPAPLVRISKTEGVRVLSGARWGLLPHWAKSAREGARMINARVETVATARAYAQSYATRRALVPADGWYEWRKDGTGGRQAYFLTPRDGSVLALAGLWSAWGPLSDRSGSQAPPASLLTFCVLTAPAVGELTDIHDRMPMVLSPDRWEEWLAEGPLEPPAEELVAGLELRPVGPAVGNVRNDGPELVRRWGPGQAAGQGTQPPLF